LFCGAAFEALCAGMDCVLFDNMDPEVTLFSSV
jgi:nicotinate-nucleotide pyrophosphorylase